MKERRRKQPAGLARAREQRKRLELDERAVVALERIAAAVEGIPGRFAIVVNRVVPLDRADARTARARAASGEGVQPPWLDGEEASTDATT